MNKSIKRKKNKTFGILGAGPSGLAVAQFLNHDYEILEQSHSVGGHAGSFYDQGYTFDYGPHIMFSKNQEVLKFMVDSLGENVDRCKRNNCVSFKNRLVRYPFENDLSALPLEDNYSCLSQFINNPYKEKYAKPKNLEQWLLKTFGMGICQAYLFPYNEKVWNIPVNKLSMVWADRIPNPPVEDIIKSAIGYKTEGYLHQLYYFYPKRGGYQAISEAWAKRINPINHGFEVKSLKPLKDGRWEVIGTQSGSEETRTYDEIVSTLPIHNLVGMLQMKVPASVKNAIRRLIVNPMYVISLGIQGTDPHKMTAIYFPEPDFLVNRLSFPTTFSPYNSPKGCYSVQAEITCRWNSPEWKMTDDQILEHTIDGLVKRGIIDRKKIVYKNVKRSRYSYVVYDSEYQENVKVIRDWFPRQKIHLCGRFSYFEYINIDAAVERAAQIAGGLNGKPVKFVEGKVIT